MAAKDWPATTPCTPRYLIPDLLWSLAVLFGWMGKRNRTSGSSASAEESSPTQRNPPPTKTPKMASTEKTATNKPKNNKKLLEIGQIQCLDVKVDGLSSEVNVLRERVRELEKTAEFYSGELDTLRDALREEQRERGYSMKPDVIVRGLPFNKEEDSARVLSRFLAEELHLPAADAMPTAAVHRLSRPTTSRPNPPLLARFVNFQDRDKVLSAGRRLRGNSRGLAVYEHLPPPLQTARSQLVNERNAELAKDNNNKVSILVPAKDTYAVLLVNGKEKRRIDAVDIVLSKRDV
ncbi:hypothetical protein Bbelb_317180 [Branchiostoma belcheri]|nr:hypothetical protein Bbelb_317180 [Branchiostoma belcheri]